VVFKALFGKDVCRCLLSLLSFQSDLQALTSSGRSKEEELWQGVDDRRKKNVLLFFRCRFRSYCHLLYQLLFSLRYIICETLFLVSRSLNSQEHKNQPCFRVQTIPPSFEDRCPTSTFPSPPPPSPYPAPAISPLTGWRYLFVLRGARR
jgi:hypothetical protein